MSRPTASRRRHRPVAFFVFVLAVVTVPSASAGDVVANDDVIVEGSVCASAVGDCGDGEVFASDLKLKGSDTTYIWLDDTSGVDDWLIGASNADDSEFHVIGGSGNRALSAEQGAPRHAMWLGPVGGVGINRHELPLGLYGANRPLHVRGDGSIAVVKAENTSSTIALRTVFSIQNFGPPSFTLIDKSPAGADWFFRSSQSGAFAISTNSTPTVELTLAPGGNVTIAGTVTQSSSAAGKQDIEPVDTAAVLAALRDLPVSSWSYDAGPAVTHMGPTAEDFHAAFGLGSSAGISALDVDGVALASLQALADQHAQLAADGLRLSAGVDALDRRLVVLEGAFT